MTHAEEQVIAFERLIRTLNRNIPRIESRLSLSRDDIYSMSSTLLMQGSGSKGHFSDVYYQVAQRYKEELNNILENMDEALTMLKRRRISAEESLAHWQGVVGREREERAQQNGRGLRPIR